MLIDSHCHLDDEQFDADRDAVIERAHAAGVERMLAIGTGDGPPDWKRAIRLARPLSVSSTPPWACIRTTPRRPRRKHSPLCAALWPRTQGAGHRRDRPRLSLRFLAARGAARGLRRAIEAGARGREAHRDPYPRGLGRHPAAAARALARRRGIMHCFTRRPGGRRARRWTSASI